MVSDELRAGTLEALLPSFVPEALDINGVFSMRRNMPTRVRHLLDFFKEWSRHPPDWALPNTVSRAACVASCSGHAQADDVAHLLDEHRVGRTARMRRVRGA
ncbi:hypothetical protein QN413_15810 [Variovorax sp. LG9.2]|nr:hypothetical protein [Variovorax sp. LG9.2]